MKKNISLRLRLTLITSILLILTCAMFTAFNFYNTGANVVDTVTAKMVVSPSYEYAADERYSITSNDSIRYEDYIPNDYAGYGYEIMAPILSSAVDLDAPFSKYSFIFMACAIIIGSVGMYLLSGLALKPAKKLADEISRIDSDKLSVRIEDFKGGDELQSISTSFNHMMDRLESAFLRESRFSAAAAHELKTPITVIKTNLDVLAMDETPAAEDYAASITVIKKQTERMNTLVQQLTLLTGAGEIPCEDKVDLKGITEEVINELDFKDLTLSTDLAPAWAVGSAVMIKHAFSNLIHNAVRYNRESGSISVSLLREGSVCLFTVKDTGIGISDEDAAHIFEPFYRADKSRSRALGGTGLGLSIVKEIVELHGGSVSYRKSTPEGSVFAVSIPSDHQETQLSTQILS